MSVEMKAPPIRGLIEMSLTHWAGRVATVVFVGGCTLRCPRCPAPHLVPAGEGRGSIPLDSVLDSIYRRRRWIEGVVVKGGEPLMSPELTELLELFRDFGLAIRLETNGTRPEALRRVIRDDLADFVAMELKAPLDDLYHRAAGGRADLRTLYRSVEILLAGEVDYEFRVAVYDDLLGEEDVVSIARMLKGARRLVLRSPPGRGPSRSDLRRLARRAAPLVECCHVDGRPADGDETPLLLRADERKDP